LDELCALCRKYRRALGLSFIDRPVAIKNKSNRNAFLRKAIIEHWGFNQFVRGLPRSFRLGHKRGRKPYLPESVPEALAEIEEAKLRFVGLLRHCAETETCLLGNLAKRMDARLIWDAARLEVTNLPEANRYVRTEYRKGWTL
jgi:hypothetical protein